MEQAEAFVEQQLERLEEELQAERDEAERLRVARDAVTARLAQTESRLAEAEKRMAESPHGGDHRAADEELQQRYETALDELRLARNKNAELQQQVARARSTAAKLAQQARKPGWLDWEAEKLRILAALEADDDQDDEAQQTERLGIVEVLRITDEVIAAKDREIQQLKKRLEEQSRDGAASAPDAASIDQVLNNDAVVREERERLNGCRRSGRRSCERRKSSWRWNVRRSPGNGPSWKNRSARSRLLPRSGPAQPTRTGSKPSRRAGDVGWHGWG